jgi:hypothetical protein
MVISGILTAESPVVLLSGAGIRSPSPAESGGGSAATGFLAPGAGLCPFREGSGSPAAHAKDPIVNPAKRRDEKMLIVQWVPRMIFFHKPERESNPFQQSGECDKLSHPTRSR